MWRMTVVAKWTIAFIGCGMIALAILLLLKEAGKMESVFAAIAMIVLGVLQVGASMVLFRPIRARMQRGFDVLPPSSKP